MLRSRVIEEIGRDGAREKKGENEKVCVCVCVCENGTSGNLVCSKGKKEEENVIHCENANLFFLYSSY